VEEGKAPGGSKWRETRSTFFFFRPALTCARYVAAHQKGMPEQRAHHGLLWSDLRFYLSNCKRETSFQAFFLTDGQCVFSLFLLAPRSDWG
jgi:hypothetical protein